MSKNRILPQMFDIRPVDETGDLDWKKIEEIENILNIRLKETKIDLNDYENPREEQPQQNYFQDASIYQLGEKIKSDSMPIFHKSLLIPRELNQLEDNYKLQEEQPDEKEEYNFKETKFEEIDWGKKESKEIRDNFKFSDLFFPARFAFNFKPRKTAFYFATASLVLALAVGGFSFGIKGLKIKGEVLGTSQEGYSQLSAAIASTKNQNFEASNLEFEKSYQKFSESSKSLDEMGKTFIEISRFFPFSSQLSSGKNLVEAGKHISLAGESLNKIIEAANSIQNPLGKSEDNNISLLEIFRSTEKEIKTVDSELEQVQENIDKVSIDDLPSDKRDEFVALKEKLPSIIDLTNGFLENSEIFTDLLGGNGPRKYLFLFQNNQEMRATGGFIGSYGLMDVSEGRIRNFFVDGIFNPDGQLQEKIIPPKPIQKISAAWSLHDSNWFPDFPASAKEAIVFYEKTGGPTADGVIALTPTVMQKLLEITGPIEMKDYGITLDSENFIEKTQMEVEVNYDREENKPKKILSDLAPILLDKIFNARDAKSIIKTLDVLSSGLEEKQMLFYSQNQDLQKIISDRGWSGEILQTQKDYLSVINTNLNGYKTDGIIDEEISHSAEIQANGEIVDTVTITRHHNGGNSPFEWWNKVNSDYVRVYVPLGSKILETEGQTRETINPPLDYQALGFKKDPLVQKEEDGIVIDEKSGTRMYEEGGKTVFANWTYVSPQETMTLEYKYLLPFKINLADEKNPADSYSLLAQKQSGSIGSKFIFNLKYPKNYNIYWNYPDNIEKNTNEAKIETKLDIDRFIGVVFTGNNAILND